MNSFSHSTKPFLWIPSLYFAEGLPYVLVTIVSGILYKRLGISNTDLALYTGWLYLPWVVKPLWSPLVDLLKTKRWWIVCMQLLVGASLAGVALTLQMPSFFKLSLLFFWLMAFSSATHDIAADGFYMLGLDEKRQAKYVGIRSLFYRLAMIVGQGALVILAGRLEIVTGNVQLAWSLVFFVLSGLFGLLVVFHWLVLPKPVADKRTLLNSGLAGEFGHTVITFFQKPGVGLALVFFLLFRLGESQLGKMASPFLLDARTAGGLALTTSEVGFIYGTVGVLSLIVGGILGGLAISANGLKYWIWWMALAVNLPDLGYVYLAYAQPTDMLTVTAFVAIEQLGYGFGFTAFLMFMMMFADGEHKTSHYAIATGFMALGMMIPGMVSGMLQSLMGYRIFFIWVTLCTVPGFVLVRFLNIEASFGKRKTLG